MGRTIKTQVPLYLIDEKVERLRTAAEKTGRTQQDLLREGLDMVLAKYRTIPHHRRRSHRR
jgi:predicted DNA-binding protein